MDKLRIGIIGTGGIAHAHMHSYLKLDDVEVVAGADIVPGKARKFFDEFSLPHANDYESAEEMLRKEQLDAVSVCTYNTQHAVCAIAALRAGCPVLLEKPMTVTLDDAIDIMRAEKETGKIVSIGFQPRYDNRMRKVREVVQSGELGKIYYVQTGGGRRRGMPGGTFMRKDQAGVGALADIGCYSLDMVLNALGYPKPLTVSASTFDYFGKSEKYNPAEHDTFGVDDFSAAYIRLEGGITLDFRMGWAMHMDSTGATIFLGTDAGLKVEPAGVGSNWGGAWDSTCGDLTLFHDQFGMPTQTPVPVYNSTESNFDQKVSAFVDAVKNGGPAPIPTSQIVYNQAIIDGIIRSAAQGKEVEIIIPEI